MWQLWFSLKQKRVIKLVFKEGVNIKVVTLYSQQIEEYFCQQEMDLPSDDDDFILQFLTDNSTTIIVDSRCLYWRKGLKCYFS